jgi:KUP system potassium uptake protein
LSDSAAPEGGEEDVAGHRSHTGGTVGLALGALGVVYGDLGTNPLFALRECFHGAHPLAVDKANVLGVVSLAVWALLLVIGIKYGLFILRADNQGEGGTLALLGKIPTRQHRGQAARPFWIILVLLFGSTLLLGDGVVTPAISVLSAIEGLELPESQCVWWTVGILSVLLLAQRFGTARVGMVFGPIMILWFVTIGFLGVAQVVAHPGILAALDPRHAARLLMSGQKGSFLVLSAVILCVAGGEALYADLGHFGRRPILVAWYGLVLPSLLVTYLGQGGMLLDDSKKIETIFYSMAPPQFRVPMVVLATAATIIASQALISGSYSLARQAINLGFLPRMTVEHTSTKQTGQIYLPLVTSVLLIGCIALVVGFRNSSALAGAYGLAVTGTMTATTIGFFVVMLRVWKTPWPLAIVVALFFLALDGGFLAASSSKIATGGWVPLSLGGALFLVAMIWRTGRGALARRIQKRGVSTDVFFASNEVKSAKRTAGTGVFLTANTDAIPPVLSHFLERVGVLPRQVVLLSIKMLDIPFVDPRRRLTVTPLEQGFVRVVARYGYEETPNVPALLESCAIHQLVVVPETVTYFLGRDSLRLKRRIGLISLPGRFFAFMARNAATAVGYYGMPAERVVEVGIQHEL